VKKNKYFALVLLSAILLPSANTISVLASETTVLTSQIITNSDDDKEKRDADGNLIDPDSTNTKDAPDTKIPETDGETSPSDEAVEPSNPDTKIPDSGTTDPTLPIQPPVKEPEPNKPSPTVPSDPKKTDESPVKPVPKQEDNQSLPVLPASTPFSSLPFSGSRPSASAFAAYVEHWTGPDAYTHNLLSHRYGIKAKQLDGFLQSTGIAYDSRRINGQKILVWEKESGLDARAIVAIGLAESSLGTQGVAKNAGANMFGYAAFDHSPQSAQQFSDDIAIVKLTQETIIQNQNTSFSIQDKKAQQLSVGMLNTSVDGGVYYTDSSGTGKRRADIMEKLDQWIDNHGGTPEIPSELKVRSSASLSNVPVGYKVSKLNKVIDYTASTYAWGQCTWYVYNRAKEFGYQFDTFMGNGGDWQHKSGYTVSHKAAVGYAVSFSPGQAGADPNYGHVAIVEEVKKDGSVLISESNCLGLGVISYRTFTAIEAAQLTYVVGKK